MPNRVYLDKNGIIQSFLVGDQDKTTVANAINNSLKIVRKYQKEHPSKPLLFAVDISEVGRQSLTSRQEGFKALKAMPFDKIALIGGNQFIRHTAALVIMASGKETKVKQFASSEEAVEWLKNG